MERALLVSFTAENDKTYQLASITHMPTGKTFVGYLPLDEKKPTDISGFIPIWYGSHSTPNLLFVTPVPIDDPSNCRYEWIYTREALDAIRYALLPHLRPEDQPYPKKR